jgi:ATP-dependent Lon protease
MEQVTQPNTTSVVNKTQSVEQVIETIRVEHQKRSELVMSSFPTIYSADDVQILLNEFSQQLVNAIKKDWTLWSFQNNELSETDDVVLLGQTKLTRLQKENQVNEVVNYINKRIKAKLRDTLDDYDFEQHISHRDAEFTLKYGNTIELDSIEYDVNADDIINDIEDDIADGVADDVQEFMWKKLDENQ